MGMMVCELRCRFLESLTQDEHYSGWSFLVLMDSLETGLSVCGNDPQLLGSMIIFWSEAQDLDSTPKPENIPKVLFVIGVLPKPDS